MDLSKTTNHYLSIARQLGVSITRKPVMFPLEDINIGFYVRQSCDPERVMDFGIRAEEDQPIDPVLLTQESHILVDGRTRFEGFNDAKDVTEIPVVFIDCEDEKMLLRVACMSNARQNSSRPPTSGDLRHMSYIMLQKGMNRKEIRDILLDQGLSNRRANSLIDDADGRIRSNQITKAMTLMADENKTVNQAAKESGIEVTVLRSALSGKKKKAASPIKAFKSVVSKAFRSFSQSWAQNFRSLYDQLFTGATRKEDVQEFLDLEAEKIRKWQNAHKDRVSRFQKYLDAEEKVTREKEAV